MEHISIIVARVFDATVERMMVPSAPPPPPPPPPPAANQSPLGQMP